MTQFLNKASNCILYMDVFAEFFNAQYQELRAQVGSYSSYGYKRPPQSDLYHQIPTKSFPKIPLRKRGLNYEEYLHLRANDFHCVCW
jgi:hypothetical protein